MADKSSVQAIMDAIAAGPPATSGATKEPLPIGVPKDYVAQRPSREYVGSILAWTERPVAPQYFEGDDARIFGGMSPEDTFLLTDELRKLGILDASKKSTTGTFMDEEVRGGLKTLLSIANMRGTTWRETVDQLHQEAIATGVYDQAAKSTAPKRAPLTVRLTNPSDLSLMADAVAKQTIGRKLRQSELAKFVSSYQGMEATAQRQAYELDNPDGSGGSSVAAPSVEAAATDMVRQQAPDEAYTMDVTNTLDSFFKMLGGPV